MRSKVIGRNLVSLKEQHVSNNHINFLIFVPLYYDEDHGCEIGETKTGNSEEATPTR